MSQRRKRKGPKRPNKPEKRPPLSCPTLYRPVQDGARTGSAYYIKRKDLQGDTEYFCDEDNRRIFFTRIRQASWVKKIFLPEQKPKIRRLPIEPGDVDFQDLIEQYRPLLSGQETEQMED